MANVVQTPWGIWDIDAAAYVDDSNTGETDFSDDFDMMYGDIVGDVSSEGVPLYSDATVPLNPDGSLSGYSPGTVIGGSGENYQGSGAVIGPTPMGTAAPATIGSPTGGTTIVGQNYQLGGTGSTVGSRFGYSDGTSTGGGAGGSDGGDLQALPKTGSYNTALTGVGGTGKSYIGAPTAGTAPTQTVIAPTGAAYTSAMNAELSELDKGMAQVRAALQRGDIKTDQQLQAALQDLSTQTGIGLNELSTQFNRSISQFDPATAGFAEDMSRLREGTHRGFDDDFQRFTESQAYKFPLDQAMEKIEGSAAAAGMLRSSDTLKNIGKYVTDYGTQQYEQFRQNRLAEAQQLAGMGLSAIGQQAGMRSQLGTQQLGARQQLGGQSANTRLGFTGYDTDLAKSGAEAVGQYYTARADARNRGIIGRGTKTIEIKL